MKCIYDDPSYTSCRRCFSSGIDCSLDNDPTAKQAKKKRRTSRKTDNDILIQLRQFQSTINEHDLSDLDIDAANQIITSISSHINMQNEQQLIQLVNGSVSNNNYASTEFPDISLNGNMAEALIIKKLITKRELHSRFAFFVEQMLPYCPLISFSSKLLDFNFQLKNTPVLLLACVHATTINDNSIFMNLPSDVTNSQHLRQILLHYLENYLANKVLFQATDFLVLLVTACLVLSLWCVVPNNGNHKNQMKLLLAYNVSLCMGLGDSNKFANLEKSTEENTAARHEVRCFLAVYCCCSSLGLSLSRFKLPKWSKDHETGYQMLVQNTDQPITDLSLSTVARLVKLGHEALEVLKPEKFKYLGSDTISIIDAYVERLVSVLQNYGFKLDGQFRILVGDKLEEYIVAFIYYQVLMNVYDNFLTHNMSLPANDNEDLSLLLFNVIIKLTTICEGLLDCFTKLTTMSINYPTFFLYKPFQALVLLIRLKLMVKSDIFKLQLETLAPVDDNDFQSYISKIEDIMAKNEPRLNQNTNESMTSALMKVKKWMTVCSNYRGKVSNGDTEAAHLLGLMMSSKNKEIEKLQPPDLREKEQPEDSRNTLHEASESTIEDIFKGMEMDLHDALNPFDAVINPESLFDHPFL